MLPNALLEVLVCPKSKQPMVYFPRGEADHDEADAFLLSPVARLRYPIQDGVPVMLMDEATEITAPAVEALLTRARQLGLPLPGGGVHGAGNGTAGTAGTAGEAGGA